MDFVFEADDMEIDPWIEDYARTTLLFAIWHHDAKVERVHVSLDRVFEEDGEPYVRCAVVVVTMGSPLVSAGCAGRDLCEAVQGAADRLEVAIYEWLAGTAEAPLHRLAA